jgi:hypothetical protein
MVRGIRCVLVLVFLLVLLLTVTATTLAQDAPQQINIALADLSQRVGRQVSLHDLWQWRWEGRVFPDTSLGCPQPGETYAQVATSGFVFLLNYRGTTYDYRVSHDGQTVILCEGEVTPAPPPAVVVPATDGVCPGLMPLRVGINQQAQVMLVTAQNLNMRAEPGLASRVINVVPNLGIVTVIDGPACGPDNIVWWLVDYDGRRGWVAENDGQFYLLQPAG